MENISHMRTLYMQGQEFCPAPDDDDVAPSVKQYKFSYRLSIYNILVNINCREIVNDCHRACVRFHNLSTKSTIDLLCKRCCNCMCLVC